MASILSPILSSDSSCDINNLMQAKQADQTATPNSVNMSNEEKRLILAAKSKNFQTPSTCTDDDDDGDDDEEEAVIDNYKRHRRNHLSNRQHNHCGADRTDAATSISGTITGGSSLSSVGSSSLAQQYLFNNGNSLNSSNNHHYYQHKKLKQIIQSIPLPLVATSIITVFILCLLLSECKSLQVASLQSPGTIQSAGLVMDSSSANEESGPSFHRSSSPLQEDETKQRPINLQAAAADEEQLPAGEEKHNYRMNPGRVGTNQRFSLVEESNPALEGRLLAMKREYISNLLNQQRATSSQSKRHLNEQHRPLHHTHTSTSEAPNLDSLGAILFGTGSSSGSEPSDSAPQATGGDGDLFIDGVSRESRNLQRIEPKPSHLRTTPPLELDLGEEQQQQQQRQPRQNNNLEVENNVLRHHHQHQQQQQQQQYNKILTNNDDHVKYIQQQHHHSNDHDRPFDVFQIQCNNTEEGFERFACPTPDSHGRYRCIEDRSFCDGYFDCPGEEDEERINCMYYKLKQNRLNTHRFEAGVA